MFPTSLLFIYDHDIDRPACIKVRAAWVVKGGTPVAKVEYRLRFVPLRKKYYVPGLRFRLPRIPDCPLAGHLWRRRRLALCCHV
jgi:hypothetical protein